MAKRENKDKDKIYAQIQADVKEATGVSIGKAAAKKLFDRSVEKMFEAVKGPEKYFRFPGGYGALKAQTIGKEGGTKRLPDGKEVIVGKREVIRYKVGINSSFKKQTS